MKIPAPIGRARRCLLWLACLALLAPGAVVVAVEVHHDLAAHHSPEHYDAADHDAADQDAAAHHEASAHHEDVATLHLDSLATHASPCALEVEEDHRHDHAHDTGQVQPGSFVPQAKRVPGPSISSIAIRTTLAGAFAAPATFARFPASPASPVDDAASLHQLCRLLL